MIRALHQMVRNLAHLMKLKITKIQLITFITYRRIITIIRTWNILINFAGEALGNILNTIPNSNMNEAVPLWIDAITHLLNLVNEYEKSRGENVSCFTVIIYKKLLTHFAAFFLL
mgnify:CR=1 FL=1